MAKSFRDIVKANQERAERDSRPKLEWFSLKNNETRFIRFLQEFETDMRNYDSSRGTAHFPVEHVSPYEWTRKALCTQDDEGRCFGCEMDKEEPSIEETLPTGETKTRFHPWGQKTNFYVYVVDSKGEVRVLSRPTSGKFFDALCDEIEENDNSLTDLTFKISKGSGAQAAWEVRSTKKEHFELPEIPELIALPTAVGLKVPYEDQRSFYLPKENKEVPATQSAESKAPKKAGEDW